MTSFVKAMTEVRTEKGALSHGTTGDPRVDLFFKTVRDTPKNHLYKLLDNSWAQDPLDTLRLIFHTRDCRGGKGEKQLFYDSLCWMIDRGHADVVETNLKNIPYFGTWKDLLELVETPVEKSMLELYARTLKQDKKRMEAAKPITLAAKWAPTEKGKHDRTKKLARLLANLLDVNMRSYRKEYLSPLRKYSNVVETKMCTNEWGAIEYQHTPSVCLYKHRKAFERHDAERFTKYLEEVKQGRVKINAKMLFPYQLVEYYLKKSGKFDLVIEEQWKSLVKHVRTMGTFANCLAIADVSGSMFTATKVRPIDVSISLSLLLAEVTDPPFRGHVLTFSSNPKFHRVRGQTLLEKVESVRHMNWEMTTNFQKVFRLIIQRCKKYRVPEANMPKRLYVFSDMQFDSAYENGDITNHAALVKKFRSAGYHVPEIVYWNLRGDIADFPVVSTTNDVALVSGFSPNLLRLFLESGDLHPYKLMRQAIDSSRYKRVVLERQFDDDDKIDKEDDWIVM